MRQKITAMIAAPMRTVPASNACQLQPISFRRRLFPKHWNACDDTNQAVVAGQAVGIFLVIINAATATRPRGSKMPEPCFLRQDTLFDSKCSYLSNNLHVLL